MRPYPLIATLAAPAIRALLLLRRIRGGESRGDSAERLGRGAGRPGALWLHGASNGELASARALAEALRAAFPDLPLVVTANTLSGRALAAGWHLPDTACRLAPLDAPGPLARFRAAWRPRLLIVMENELWPERIVSAPHPVLYAGARMSERSFRRWQKLPRLARGMFSRIDTVFAQDAASARRFAALGARRIGATGTLKSNVQPAVDAALLDRYAPLFVRADTVLAASTHEGEEEIVLDAFAQARARRPGLRLILAPRHPRRAEAVAAAIGAAGLSHLRRTEAEPDADSAVYLADTLGEMGLWYALAGATFVGGSLVPRGGHTPFEPAAAGSAILHGPHTDNFTAEYAALDAGGGAVCAEDAAALGAALVRLADPARQARLAETAREILAPLDDSARLIAAIVDEARALVTAPDPAETA